MYTVSVLTALVVAVLLSACSNAVEPNSIADGDTRPAATTQTDTNYAVPISTATNLAPSAAISQNDNILVAQYRMMTVEELAAVVSDESSPYTVVNVHIPYQGEVAGTDYNIAFNDLDALVSTLPDRNAPIVLYCRSGNMSEQATRRLVELGYTSIYDVPGGMNTWQASGRDLVSLQ